MTRNDSIIKYFEGEEIRIDPTNNYPCLTDMARATGKKVNDFLRLDNTKDFIKELSSITGIPAIELLMVASGNTGGTYAHPQLGIKFAGWLSAKFEVLMTGWIFELLSTGNVKLTPGYGSSALPFGDDLDRIENMAVSTASRRSSRLDESEEPRDKIDFPDWFTVTEMLNMFGEDNSFLTVRSFRRGVERLG